MKACFENTHPAALSKVTGVNEDAQQDIIAVKTILHSWIVSPTIVQLNYSETEWSTSSTCKLLFGLCSALIRKVETCNKTISSLSESYWCNLPAQTQFTHFIGTQSMVIISSAVSWPTIDSRWKPIESSFMWRDGVCQRWTGMSTAIRKSRPGRPLAVTVTGGRVTDHEINRTLSFLDTQRHWANRTAAER